VIVYIFLVAVANLAVGFALAVYLGRRYRCLLAAADPLALSLATAATSTGATETVVLLPTSAASAPAPDSQAASILRLQNEVEHYYGELIEADDKLRENAKTPDAAAIKECLTSLESLTQGYRQQRAAAYTILASEHPGGIDLGPILSAMTTAIEREDVAIEAARQGMAGFDYQADLQAGCRQVLGQTSTLADANHNVRDVLDEALVGIDRQQRKGADGSQGAAAGEAQGVTAEATCHAGLELALSEWWRNDPDHARQLAVALFDVDQFRQVNERFGPKAGDRVLQALGQFLQSQQHGESIVARFAGQRFLFFFPDADVHYTTGVVERIRQSVEATRFECHDEEIRLTISCAVVEAASRDTAASLCQRADAALREAKRYGRNRTFLYEGEYPTPVVPPSFSLEEKPLAV
jgi:diguanylate cyclase (GGDEF)-like protein